MFKKILAISNHTLFWSTAITTAIFFIMIILNVVARFIMKSPILGAVELSRLFFIWASFLGATICYHRSSHIAISFVVDRFSSKVRNVIDLFVYGLTLIFFIVVAIHSLELVQLFWNTTFPITRISQSWLYIPVPVSMLFLIIYTIDKIKDKLILIKS
jgi:TRAP-type transport system small permease protein